MLTAFIPAVIGVASLDLVMSDIADPLRGKLVPKSRKMKCRSGRNLSTSDGYSHFAPKHEL